MGYRSEVAIKCGESAFDALITEVRKHNWHPDTVFKSGNNSMIYFNWVKWYDDFDFVSGVKELLSQFDDYENEHGAEVAYDSGYAYRFLRIGEGGDSSFDDIESYGSPMISIPVEVTDHMKIKIEAPPCEKMVA